MSSLFEQARQELLSFCTGEPVISTLISTEETGDTFHLLVYVRSISDCIPTYIQSVQLQLILPSDYPDASPSVCLFRTKLFHPNFSASGEWTDSELRQNETMEDYVLRLIRVLQFKEINADKAANRNAMAWFNRYADSGVFPADRINYYVKPHIIVKKVNNTPPN